MRQAETKEGVTDEWVIREDGRIVLTAEAKRHRRNARTREKRKEDRIIAEHIARRNAEIAEEPGRARLTSGNVILIIILTLIAVSIILWVLNGFPGPNTECINPNAC